MILINGKPLQAVFEELKMPFTGAYDNVEGKDSIDYRYYHERLRSVLGMEHYQVSYTKPAEYLCINTSSQQHLFIAHCRIDLIDDDGLVVYSTSASGAKEVQTSKSTGKGVWISNYPAFAEYSAFKNVCKNLNVFNQQGIGTKGNNKESQKPNPGTAVKDSGIYKFEDSFYTVTRNDKIIYKCKVRKQLGELFSTVSEIVIYPDKFQRYRELTNIVNDVAAKKPVSIRASISCGNVSEKLPQLILQTYEGRC